MAAARRSQAERSATTREALLDATIACLVEEGYANTTTARVAERAGVSRGAHLHHFQTRSALVAAAVEHLRVAPRRGAAWPPPTRCRPGPSASPQALDLLWRSYTSPLFQGALDLWSARPHRRRAARAPRRRSSATSTARRSSSRGGSSREAAERPDFEQPDRARRLDDPRPDAARHAARRAASATAASGRSAARGSLQCSKKASDHALTCRLRPVRASAGVPRRWGLGCWRWGWSRRD